MPGQVSPIGAELRGAGVRVPEREFEFDDVTVRVFPLRASLNRLERLCDRYLNIAPDVVRYRPAMPWVFFIAVNYGSMTGTAGNAGWVAQNEFAFTVPLEWYEVRDGRPRLRDWAAATPYIFVDQEQSLETGREVFGWPKVMAWLEPEIDSWMKDPRSQRRVLCMKTLLFPELYRGRRPKPTTLLEVRQEVSQTLLQMPPNSRYLYSPWVGVPDNVLTSLDLGWDLGRLELRQIGDSGPLRVLFQKVMQLLRPATGRLSSNLVNLKQFRCSEDPGLACYQAIVNAQLMLTAYLGSGLLGDLEMLRGDPTGGFRLELRRTPAFPIIENLGLEVTGETREGSKKVSILKPFFPFWIKADLSLSRGENLFYRCGNVPLSLGTLSSSGSPPSGSPPSGSPPSGSSSNGASPVPRPLYNTALGPVTPVLPGPFEFSDSVLRVLPLAGRIEVLRETLRSSLDTRGVTFEPGEIEAPDLGPGRIPVLLVIATYGSMSAEANNVGWWAQRELSFLVPLKLRISDGDSMEELDFFYCPFVFSDSPIAVTTGREATGQPTAFARLLAGADRWLDSSVAAWTAGEPLASRRLLKLATRLFPAVGVGARGEERTLLEINRTERRGEAGTRQHRDHLGEMADRVGQGTMSSHALVWKEFRDAEDPNRPCYQALVAYRTLMKESGILHDPHGDVEVGFHRYPQFPFVRQLGLEVDREDEHEGGKVEIVKARSPFSVRADLRIELGREVFWRVHGGPWQGVEEGIEYLRELTSKSSDDEVTVREILRGKAPGGAHRGSAE